MKNTIGSAVFEFLSYRQKNPYFIQQIMICINDLHCIVNDCSCLQNESPLYSMLKCNSAYLTIITYNYYITDSFSKEFITFLGQFKFNQNSVAKSITKITL